MLFRSGQVDADNRAQVHALWQGIKLHLDLQRAALCCNRGSDFTDLAVDLDRRIAQQRDLYRGVVELDYCRTGRVVPDRLVLSANRSEEHTSELQSLSAISYAVFCLKKTTSHLELTPAVVTPAEAIRYE